MPIFSQLTPHFLAKLELNSQKIFVDEIFCQVTQEILPISAVIPTCNRARALWRVLESLKSQSGWPMELIVIDGSTDSESRSVVESWALQVPSKCSVMWQPAKELGAAIQRNQGVEIATQPFFLFFDDDILFEPECLRRLWRALELNSRLGGASTMIVNQFYQRPGFLSRLIFTLMHGRSEDSFAGRVVGPAVNLLPEDRKDLPEVVPVEWLNLGCTIYRREALPSPTFDSMFTGYSMMEDLTLSLRVGRQWQLANVRTARIFHDSQPGAHKNDVTELAAMELVNRHYVMTEVLRRRSIPDYIKLMIWECFQLGVCAVQPHSRKQFWSMCQGKVNGINQIRKRLTQRSLIS